MNKIGLGTAQFGLDYGINNQRGMIPESEVTKILDLASSNGIDTLDTANVYGASENRIGEYMLQTGKCFKIVSKLPGCNLAEVESFFFESLKRLKKPQIYGYLIHSFNAYKKEPEFFDILHKLKKENRIVKIGFTIYYPYELEYLLENNSDFDLVQLPYSIFDQRFAGYFDVLKKRSIEIHVRSVFLQGLVFRDIHKLGNRFEKVKDKLIKLHRLAEEFQIGVSDICLNFVLLNDKIDRIIVGVDNLKHLRELLHTDNNIQKVKLIYDELKSFHEDDEKVILPILWE